MTGSTNYDYAKAIAWRSGGSTQLESRSYNERLVVSLIRIHGELSKAELTVLTGLAPQTVSSLVNAAFDAGLLIQLEPRRGGLGKPSTPYALRAGGSYAFGLTFYKSGCALSLIDFSGSLVENVCIDLPTLSPVSVLTEVTAAISYILNLRFDGKPDRISGLGIASPFYSGLWETRLGLTPDVAELWMTIDLRHELDKRFEFPVYLSSEGAAIASSDMLFGPCLGRPNFISIHFGEVISGGLILDNRLYVGSNQLAGRLGDISVNHPGQAAGNISLNDLLGRRSPNVASIEKSEEWCSLAVEAVAPVFSTAIELLDLDCISVDGNFSESERHRFANLLRVKMAHTMSDRPSPLTIVEGQYGPDALKIGAGSIPMMFRFTNNIDVLTKT